MDLLNSIRSITTSNTSFQLWSEPNQVFTSTLANATHVALNLTSINTQKQTLHPSKQPPSSTSSSSSSQQLIELSTLLPLYSTKGQLSVASVIYAWDTRELPFASYLTGATSNQLTSTAVFERHDLLDWLKGSKPQCTHLLSQPLLSNEKPRIELMRIPGRTDATEKLKKIKAKEYSLRTRTSYLTPPGNKTFSHLTKLCQEIFVSNKLPKVTIEPTVKKPLVTSKRSSGTEPILLVPPGFNPLLNMFNVKPFLESAIFETTEEIKAKGMKKPMKLEIQRKAPVNFTHLTSNVMSFSTSGGSGGSNHHGGMMISGSGHGGSGSGSGSGGSVIKKTWKLIVLDSVDKFEPEDWDRVVAVFAGGMTWQFHDFKWQNPVDLFSQVRGYHLKYADEETKPPVNQWNVKVLSLHRTKRHLDQSLVLEFWSDLEKWVTANKPHLLQ